MTPEGLVRLVAFLMVSSGVLLVSTLVSGRRSRLDARLDGLSGRGDSHPEHDSIAAFARTALPRMGTALVPTDEEERSLLKSRLVHAGFYGRQAMPIFLGVKMLLMIAPAMLGLVAGMAGITTVQYGVIGGAFAGVLGMVGPSFWLDNMKARRQSRFRRALPDALDVLVICLEGGLSMPGSLTRISGELRAAHPELAAELNVVQREVQLGRSTGDALRQMGTRTDLEEIRSLASVITQSEKFGASLVKSLRVHAETLREKRKQRAEEMAAKAVIKVIFPTALFIFPAIFVVILGPAAFQVMEAMSHVNQ